MTNTDVRLASLELGSGQVAKPFTGGYREVLLRGGRIGTRRYTEVPEGPTAGSGHLLDASSSCPLAPSGCGVLWSPQEPRPCLKGQKWAPVRGVIMGKDISGTIHLLPLTYSDTQETRSQSHSTASHYP